MPIKPENKKLYPANWKEIRQEILERAKHSCESCGVPNYEYNPNRVVLTIAHLDQDPTNNSEGNLAALCQACHLYHDREHNIKKARETRRQKKADRDLFEDVE